MNATRRRIRANHSDQGALGHNKHQPASSALKSPVECNLSTENIESTKSTIFSLDCYNHPSDEGAFAGFPVPCGTLESLYPLLLSECDDTVAIVETRILSTQKQSCEDMNHLTDDGKTQDHVVPDARAT
jgi:hypothetical protein